MQPVDWTVILGCYIHSITLKPIHEAPGWFNINKADLYKCCDKNKYVNLDSQPSDDDEEPWTEVNEEDAEDTGEEHHGVWEPNESSEEEWTKVDDHYVPSAFPDAPQWGGGTGP